MHSGYSPPPPLSAGAQRVLAQSRPERWWRRLVCAVRGHAARLPDFGGHYCARCGRMPRG